jgi:hypothetical protein
VLRRLKTVKFSFRVDGDPALSSIPQWIVSAAQKTMAVPTPPPPRGSTSQARPRSPVRDNRNTGSATGQQNSTNSSSGGGQGGFNFDSFLKSVETSLDSFVGKVDAAADLAAKFINEQLEQPASGGGTGGGGGSGATGGAPMLSSILGGSTSGSVSGGSGAWGGGGNSKGPSGRITPFFGSTLRELVLDDRRTPHAYLNPLLGVPTQAARMLAFVSARASTPDLFRRPVSSAALSDLRREVEEERDFTASAEVSAVALLLMQWLNQLPEPLLGYEHYGAILACSELEDPEHRVRNLALLVQEASWYCKPLLVRLLGLLQRCVQPQLAAANNLNLIAVSVLATPCLLRPYVPALHATPQSFFQDTEGRERIQMAATAAGSTIIEFLIANQGAILQRTREDLAQREATLSAKCARVAALQESAKEGVDTMFPDYLDQDAQAAIRELWQLLELAEQAERGLFTPSVSQSQLSGSAEGGSAAAAAQPTPTPPSSSTSSAASPVRSPDPATPPPLQDLLVHERWARCGFLPPELPLRDFNAPFGLLALKCLTGFMRGYASPLHCTDDITVPHLCYHISFEPSCCRYHKQGAAMVREYSQQRRGGAMLAGVALQLVRLAMEVLRLLPPAPPATAAAAGSGNSSSSASSSSNSAARSVAAAAPPSAAVLAKQPSWLLLNEDRCLQVMNVLLPRGAFLNANR